MNDGRLDVLEAVLDALQANDRLTTAICLQLENLAAELKREWQDIAVLRDELHTLSLAVVSAGIPLVDPPPLRSVG